MPMRSQRFLSNKSVNNAEINELRSDLKRMIVITIISIILSFITYRLNNCFRESLFCTILSILATGIIGLFYWKEKNEEHSKLIN